MIVKGEADAKYRSRVLPLGIYFPLYNTFVLYSILEYCTIHETIQFVRLYNTR
jgi:hypothetical protein